MRNLTKDATLTYDEKLERKEEEKQSSWLDSNARLPDQLASEPPAEQQPLPLSSSDILLNHFTGKVIDSSRNYGSVNFYSLGPNLEFRAKIQLHLLNQKNAESFFSKEVF